MQTPEPDYYAALGLDHRCTDAQIRNAYRLLAKQQHPDLNQGSFEAVTQTQKLNAAYEVLSDPKRRKDHDQQLAAAEKRQPARDIRTKPNISQDVHLRIDEFFRGTSREVRVDDPGNPAGKETYDLVVPPETPVGTRFRIRRAAGGVVILRMLALPHFQFKVRGADLRCDLKIPCKRAAQGGEEMVAGPIGGRLRVKIRPGIARGEIVRIPDGGLPKARGGRGDLLVRIMYQPEVRVSRRS